MANRDFNIAGPCVAGRHYMLDPLRGISDEMTSLIDNGQYFIIHAARQSGKTTLLWELADRINAQGKFYALYCSLEALDGTPDPEKGMPEIIKKIAAHIEEQGLPTGFAKNADYSNFTGVLKSSLVAYCHAIEKPLVILFDEVDCLCNGTLIAFLRQLREGYTSRGRVSFVHSVALAGERGKRRLARHI